MPEEPAVIRSHQKRRIGPAADKLTVIELLIDHHIQHAQRQGRIGTRPDRQPQVACFPGFIAAGIDNDDSGASFAGCVDILQMFFPGCGRVMTPQENTVGVFKIGLRHTHAIGVLGAMRFMPAADMDGAVVIVGAAECQT